MCELNLLNAIKNEPLRNDELIKFKNLEKEEFGHTFVSPKKDQRILDFEVIDYNMNFGVSIDRALNDDLKEFMPPFFIGFDKDDLAVHSFYVPKDPFSLFKLANLAKNLTNMGSTIKFNRVTLEFLLRIKTN